MTHTIWLIKVSNSESGVRAPWKIEAGTVALYKLCKLTWGNIHLNYSTTLELSRGSVWSGTKPNFLFRAKWDEPLRVNNIIFGELSFRVFLICIPAHLSLHIIITNQSFRMACIENLLAESWLEYHSVMISFRIFKIYLSFLGGGTRRSRVKEKAVTIFSPAAVAVVWKQGFKRIASCRLQVLSNCYQARS